MRVSVVIPARNEKAFLGRCIASIQRASVHANLQTEIIVVANRCTDGTIPLAHYLGAKVVEDHSKTIAAVRNCGVRCASEEIVMTIDADSWMGLSAMARAVAKLHSGCYVGGGSTIRPERLSLGILASIIFILPVLARYRVSVGMFWFHRSTFDAIGGFDESLVSAEDLDFGRRLRVYGRNKNLRYGTLRGPGIFTSCRKFDQFGDWYMLRHPRLTMRLLSGRDRSAADSFYYNVR